MALQYELLALFSDPEIMEQIMSNLAQRPTTKQTGSFMETLFVAIRFAAPVYRHVLPKYGFQGTPLGLRQAFEACAAHFDHTELLWLVASVDRAIYGLGRFL
eukprot:CAMPEP_0168472722 /NCGR_PEP_ID=MMETSP0228-20121227/59948_1 /TAXON_ID=133427 /ORGANISM="Protoceratium reticulatum, Strain CCCM 535 (=CCMP 1889)" /LENGTH=101 /DNA_ID=CAMNT_0008488679 /DNA_START=6 /DNA_END=308 /DNA_ORIENTATION=-